jgi:hypothetical protein
MANGNNPTRKGKSNLNAEAAAAEPVAPAAKKLPFENEDLAFSYTHGWVCSLAMDALRSLMNSGEGYVRITADLDGKMFWRWKWTEGQHAGYYVMFVADKYTPFHDGANGLAAKAGDVWAGKRKPTKDKPYMD